MKKWLIIFILIVAVGAFLRIAVFGRKASSSIENQEIAVEAMRADLRDVVQRRELIGTIAADKTAQVFPETMGRVTSILVRDGSYVTKDQPLLMIKNESIGFDFETATVKSPINGAMAKILTEVGSLASPQAPVAIVVDFSTVKLMFNVAEADAPSIRLNQKIDFTSDGVTDEVFSAVITEISPVVDPMTRTVSVKATAANPRARLKPGMTCRAVVSIAEKRNTLAVLRDALTDNALFVVGDDSVAQRRAVKIGMVGDEYAEITDGLQAGELVIILGQQRLAGGEKVKVLVRN